MAFDGVHNIISTTKIREPITCPGLQPTAIDGANNIRRITCNLGSPSLAPGFSPGNK